MTIAQVSGPLDRTGEAVGAEGLAPGVRAFMDIGTNSVRMVIVRFGTGGSHVVTNIEKETVRLGEGEFSGGDLQPEAMDRAVLVCANLARMARASGAREIVAVATSATREARNRRAFVDRLREEAGIEARTISGREEARLIYLGVASGVHLDGRRAAFIDIGGGSTEIIVGGQHEYDDLDSLKAGAIRLATLFDRSGGKDPVSGRRYAAMRQYTRDAALRIAERVRERPVEMAIGGSGTIENVADIVFRQLHGRPRTRDDTVTLDEVRTVARTLRKLPLDERRRVPGINPDRADIIVPGAAILESLMEALGIVTLHISDRGLREGLIVDYVARHDPLHLTRMTVRERSVMQLGHACRFDADHARNVATLALALFDSGAEEGLHDLGPAERELLYYASLLHDIGTFLSHSQHERHAHYMIKNADLLGFNQSEVAAVAAVARFHRKGFPSAKRPEVRDLDRGYQRSLPALSVLLRLAESLDRSHAGLVDAARLQAQGDGDVALLVHAPTEPLLEIWGARQQRAAFRQAFGRQLLIRSTAGGA